MAKNGESEVSMGKKNPRAPLARTRGVTFPLGKLGVPAPSSQLLRFSFESETIQGELTTEIKSSFATITV
jgi:hypothetical protein